MANHPSYLLHFLTICVFIVRFVVSSPIDDFSILDFHGDYSPPAPPPPSTPPHPPTMSCEGDLKGVGSLDTLCELNCSLIFVDDVYIEGAGSFYILPGVRFSCPKSGCSISINVSSNFSLGVNSQIFAGMVYVAAGNASFQSGSLVNTTALGGEPPDHTSGSPKGLQGGGGGHGGRGASCVVDNKKLPEDVWGGDAYEWSSLDKPCGYGSKGGTTSKDDDYGGNGGGRIWLEVSEEIEADGSLLADGGDGGIKGGGGSGGSIYIKSHRMTGSGLLSASGGNGFAGGGGGRISVDIFSRHDDQTILVHGGKSYGCPKNSGAAGTFYDAIPRKLRVSNHNMSTDTDTPFFAFPNQPLWTSVDILELARVDVPLRWSRVQVQGQLALSMGAVLSFGLPHDAVSEFELMAEELLISDSVIKIYGALRMFVKLHLMLNSKMLIDGDGDDDSFVATTILEASNLLVLKGSSVIRSNANLGLHGQGSLNLTGSGNLIEAQHLVLSLFCSINVEPGSVLRGPLENSTVGYSPYCELQDCPMELLRPPEDCNVNSTLPFTLQICRVEDIVVEGLIEGSVLHFHMVRAVVVKSSGAITASGLGCIGGPGRGNFSSNTPGGGGGHGGKGGDGYYNGSFIEGGVAYGNADFPCELGSGSGNASLSGATAGGGVIVMGSLEHSLSSLSVYGSLTSNGESFGEKVREQDGVVIPEYGPGGGSGGTILFFVNRLALGDSSTISTVGGRGSPNSGGGGGGRVHFHWADITVGDEYQPLAHVNGTINIGGGIGRGNGLAGGNGTISGKVCPKGLYGTFCEECPVGTFKNVSGSDITLCQRCPPRELPARGIYVPVRGGVADVPCPYKCVSETYHMPNCQTALEELIYTFGGPWLFGFILLSLLILFALVLSVARVKFVGAEEVPGLVPTRRGLHIDRSVPFLESLNEVLETNRNEESHTHVHRMYFMGSNTFSQPWHLPHSPPEQVTEIVYEDAFNRFAEEINVLAAYQWWEGSLYSILCIFAYPFSWSWLQWCRKNKIQRLREFVRSEYDHACLRSCRSRALYEGLKVSASSDLMLAYVDFFLGGDEKRDDLPPQLNERFPLSLVFGGDGSYMASFVLHSDNILTSLMSQAVPSTIWYRLVAGLNAQLRLVRRYQLKSTFRPVMGWLETHANPTLSPHGIQVHLARFQPTASGGCQFGLVVSAVEVERVPPPIERNGSFLPERQSSLGGTHPRKDYLREREPLITQRRIYEGISHTNGLQMLTDNILCYPFSFIICNTKPVGHQDLVGMVISILLLGDFILVLLTLLQLYSISMLDFLLVLFILPLGILLPFPAGISALFSHAPRRSSGLARFYAMWNITSLINVVVAFVCGYAHYMSLSSASNKHQNVQSWNLSMDDSGWWMLPSGLVLCKIIQAQLIDYHVANQEIQDRTLYCNDPNVFWQS